MSRICHRFILICATASWSVPPKGVCTGFTTYGSIASLSYSSKSAGTVRFLISLQRRVFFLLTSFWSAPGTLSKFSNHSLPSASCSCHGRYQFLDLNWLGWSFGLVVMDCTTIAGDLSRASLGFAQPCAVAWFVIAARSQL